MIKRRVPLSLGKSGKVLKLTRRGSKGQLEGVIKTNTPQGGTGKEDRIM